MDEVNIQTLLGQIDIIEKELILQASYVTRCIHQSDNTKFRPTVITNFFLDTELPSCILEAQKYITRISPDDYQSLSTVLNDYITEINNISNMDDVDDMVEQLLDLPSRIVNRVALYIFAMIFHSKVII